ncbi:putative transcription regulator, AraC family protein [Pseudohongiella nitratireducens]|uniref:Transcription regulator, AraC family protein n=2 Tax=Pseudohongiella nitratireducens TaxID=1768907 RepID=A0A916QMU9_9GAMM|nr:putative transcription regulator, AraC family protein [Pseudohongiella nitratireducens]
MSDIAIPLDLFRHVRTATGEPAYKVTLCGVNKTLRNHGMVLRPDAGLDHLKNADTVVVPGRNDAMAASSPKLLNALKLSSTRGTRIASICTGSVVLAQAGLLNGLRATSHWLVTDQLAAAYPDIHVDANQLYIDNGQVLTSAGAAAAHDLCLHMIRCDYGAAVAAATARVAVMPVFREGGQAQFIDRNLIAKDKQRSLSPVLRWIEKNHQQPLRLSDIAQEAAMSVRTLNRRFTEELGVTPIQWLLQYRVSVAQQLLEESQLGVEQIAFKVGFGSTSVFRKQFRRITRMSAVGYRCSFRQTA